MRRRDGGTDRRGAGDAAPDPVVGRDFDHRLVRCLRARLANARPGGFGNPLWGHYDPCARSSLTTRFHHGHASADRRLSCRLPCAVARAATERRKASPPRQRGRRAADKARLLQEASLGAPFPSLFR